MRRQRQFTQAEQRAIREALEGKSFRRNDSDRVRVCSHVTFWEKPDGSQSARAWFHDQDGGSNGVKLAYYIGRGWFPDNHQAA